MIKRHIPSKEELRAIHSKHGVGGSAIRVSDVYTKSHVKLKKPEYLKHVKIHKNGRTTETIIAGGYHPRAGHRIRQIVYKKTHQ